MDVSRASCTSQSDLNADRFQLDSFCHNIKGLNSTDLNTTVPIPKSLLRHCAKDHTGAQLLGQLKWKGRLSEGSDPSSAITGICLRDVNRSALSTHWLS